MQRANIAEVKDHFSHFLGLVQQGETVQVCKRNVPIARVIPETPAVGENRTQLGCGKGTGRITGDITEPAIDSDSWHMLVGE